MILHGLFTVKMLYTNGKIGVNKASIFFRKKNRKFCNAHSRREMMCKSFDDRDLNSFLLLAEREGGDPEVATICLKMLLGHRPIFFSNMSPCRKILRFSL